MHGVRQNIRNIAAVRGRFLGPSCAFNRSGFFSPPRMRRKNEVEIGVTFFLSLGRLECLEFLMVADEDLPVSTLFYTIAVIVVMEIVIIGGSFLWFR